MLTTMRPGWPPFKIWQATKTTTGKARLRASIYDGFDLAALRAAVAAYQFSFQLELVGAACRTSADQVAMLRSRFLLAASLPIASSKIPLSTTTSY